MRCHSGFFVAFQRRMNAFRSTPSSTVAPCFILRIHLQLPAVANSSLQVSLSYIP